MNHYKQLFKEKTISGIFIGISFSLTVLIFGFVYATASWGSLPTVNSGSGLTATAWNDLVAHVNQSVKQASPVITVSGSSVGIGNVNPGATLDINGDTKSLNTPKAWVTFNGINLTIYDSYGVSSIIRSAVATAGAYKINWTKPFSNTYYVVTGSCNAYGLNGPIFTLEWNSIPGSVYQGLFTGYTNVGCRITATNANTDSDLVTVVVYGR